MTTTKHMTSLTVNLANRSYPIHIGPGLLTQGKLLAQHLPQPKAVIITNTVVAPLYLDALQTALARERVEVHSIVLPDGEAHKNWQTLNQVFDTLMSLRAERKTTLIALGGGVIGDLAGFAAAVYQRGAPFIQIPTTLLAQVDSSVGGKTAINHPLGKNMIGAFYQPKAVIADTDVLETLPDRELSAGIAEIVKYGLIGHTFGHAIESGLGYGEWLHGEAIAAGMVIAARVSQGMGLVGTDTVGRAAALLRRARLPVRGPALGAERYLELMGHDKKVEGGKLRFVLLRGIGEAFVSDAVPREVLVAVLSGEGVDGR